MNETQADLCKNCSRRFRRVFLPKQSEEYEDADGNSVIVKEDNIIITNICLLSGMDLDGESTIECNHYKEKDGKECKIPFFKCLE